MSQWLHVGSAHAGQPRALSKGGLFVLGLLYRLKRLSDSWLSRGGGDWRHTNLVKKKASFFQNHDSYFVVEAYACE